MAAKVAKKASNILVWTLLGLLMIGLAGFGIGSFGGSASEVGSVGTASITANDYARALQAEMRAQQAERGETMNLAQLRAAGLDRAVLDGLVARAALSHEAGAMGLSVGDEVVAQQVRESSGFQGVDGGFDRQGYEFALQQAGLNAAEFEADVREDVARSLLQAAVIGGLNLPDLAAEALVAYQSETRDFTVARLLEDDLPEAPGEPTEAELQAHYDENGARFTRPEARRISYAWITPAMIMDSVEVDRDALRELYDERAEIYIQPERRLLERLVYPTREGAEAARAGIDSGATDFDTLVEDRGLTLEDVDMGEVAEGDLSDAAAAVIFADETSEILGPLDSAFGPAIFRVNAVLQASETSFEEAAPDLRAELAAEAARRLIDGALENYDDLLAGGASLEDLAAETDMTLGQIDFGPGVDAEIAGYDAFRQAALAAAEGDFPEILQLSDGGLFALRLDEIVPPTLPPLDEIAEEVAGNWRAAQLRAALAERANALVAQMAAGGDTIESLGLDMQEETAVRRRDFVPEAPPTLVAQVFQLSAPGDMVVIPARGAAFVARLDAINMASRDAPDASVLLELIGVQLTNSLAQDVFEGYGQALEADAGISLDPSMINAVHAQFP